MGLLDKLFHRAGIKNVSPGATPTGGGWFGFITGPSTAGVTVTPQTALSVNAVMACCQILADAAGMIPIHLRGKDGAKLHAHTTYRLVHDRPNPLTSAPVFRSAMMLNLALWGNAYSFIEKDAEGRPVALWPLASAATRIVRQRQGLLYQTILGDTAPTLTPDAVLHFVGPLSVDAVEGLSPVRLVSETLGISKAMEGYQAGFFGKGCSLGGIIEAPAMSPEAQANFLARWRENYAGADNAHKVAVLPGMKFHATQVNPEDTQLVAADLAVTRKIARAYRVPPHLIGDLEKASYASVEMQSQEFMMYTMMPYLVKAEAEYNAKLLLESEKREGLEIRANPDALLRPTTDARYSVYSKAITAGIMSPNEARAIEGLAPIEGGDIYLRPLAMAVTNQAPAA